ncbi:hypothetical protein [Gordonia sp. 'Campus']|uniref:hypothetical protein n=1 Tax=Gordonia sp. 'Campus' TaxID=2915824 RepID=UPI001EE3A9A6|nr:hypothetical protein [Gordonia sp. 'Campus']
MSVLDSAVPAVSPYVVDSAAAADHAAAVDNAAAVGNAAASTPHRRGPHGAWSAFTARREVSVGVRYLSTVGAGMLAFAPALVANFEAALAGSPTTYLLFVPLWGVMIAFGLVTRARGREIGDGEFDRILVLVLGGALGLTATLVVPRIPAVAAFWHADLIPLLIWVFAASIVSFGIRRVVRSYLVWLFVLTCFPPNFLLLGQVLGGSTFAFGFLTLCLALIVAYLSLRNRPRLALATAVAAGMVGFALVVALQDTPALAYSVPAGVVTSMALGARLLARRPARSSSGLPKQSIATLAAGWMVAVFILAFVPQAQNSVNIVAPPTVGVSWLTQLRTLGIGISVPQVFDWGPRAMGKGGDVRRYRLTPPWSATAKNPVTAAYLDVYSTTDPGRFASYRRGLWYETVPPAVIADTPSAAGDLHTQIGSISNTSEAVRTSDDALWTGRFWGWRTPDAGGDRYTAFYLMAARDQTRPEDVPEPRLPSYTTAVVEPIGWLIRGGVDDDDEPVAGDTAVDAALTDLAWSMVDAGEQLPRR